MLLNLSFEPDLFVGQLGHEIASGGLTVVDAIERLCSVMPDIPLGIRKCVFPQVRVMSSTSLSCIHLGLTFVALGMAAELNVIMPTK